MEINFIPKSRAYPGGLLQINDAAICYKNFSGVGSTFNSPGKRNFSVVIPNEDICQRLQSDCNQYGDPWKVKIKPPKEPGDTAFMHMPINVKFNGRGPKIYLVSGENVVELTEETVGCLDHMEIASVNLDVRPYDDMRANGESFRTAYLAAMEVHQRIDRFAAQYAQMNGGF